MARTKPAPHDIQTFSITSPVSGDVLQYNGTAWANTAGGTAASTTYDNLTSGLIATDVQAAIDEVVANGPGGTPTEIVSTGAVTSVSVTDGAIDLTLNTVNAGTITDLVTTCGYATGNAPYHPTSIQVAFGRRAMDAALLPFAITDARITSPLSLQIVDAGTTDFTVLGAANNTPGTTFVYNGTPATGTGTVVGDLSTGNIAVGPEALRDMAYGSSNTTVGEGAGANGLWGDNNVGIGFAAISALTGHINIGIGDLSLSNADGDLNIGIGNSAITSAVGNSNIGIGSNALANVIGNSNICIGTNAGNLIGTGSNNVIIGGYYGSANVDNNIVLSNGTGIVHLQFDGLQWNNSDPWIQSGTLELQMELRTSTSGEGQQNQALFSEGVGFPPVWSDILANVVVYDPASSGFVATDVQGAIDELAVGIQAILDNINGP